MSKRMMRKREEECSLYWVICQAVACQKAHEQMHDKKRERVVRDILCPASSLMDVMHSVDAAVISLLFQAVLHTNLAWLRQSVCKKNHFLVM